MLTTFDHSRDSAGLTYIYPVVSRRSGGLSIGVNLNPNHACNWRCIYCQVPGLRRGSAPTTDMALLEAELRGFLADVLQGDFFQREAMPLDQRSIRDIAISGNGEPTSSAEFAQVVALIGATVREYGLLGRIKLVLITNGSLMRREIVQRGLTDWEKLGGEVWFKLDSASVAGIERINNVHYSPTSALGNLKTAAGLCPTWVQTCLFAVDGQPPSAEERQAYLDFLRLALCQGIPVRGVLLYGLARPSLQAEAPRLAPLPAAWMEAVADEIRALGLDARLSV